MVGLSDLSRWPKEWANAPAHSYPRGSILFRENAEVRVIHFLVAGVVKLVALNGCRDLLVDVRTPPCLLGATTAITGRQHGTTAIAMTDCETRLVLLYEFHRLAQLDSMTMHALISLLAGEVIAAHERLVSIGGGDSEARLACLFRELFRAAGRVCPDGATRLDLDLSVTEVADLVSVSRQWASQRLSHWSRRALLIRDRGWFVAPKGSALLCR